MVYKVQIILSTPLKLCALGLNFLPPISNETLKIYEISSIFRGTPSTSDTWGHDVPGLYVFLRHTNKSFDHHRRHGQAYREGKKFNWSVLQCFHGNCKFYHWRRKWWDILQCIIWTRLDTIVQSTLFFPDFVHVFVLSVVRNGEFHAAICYL